MKTYELSSGLAARSATSTNLLYEVLTRLQELGLDQEMLQLKQWQIASWLMAHSAYKELVKQANATILQGAGSIASGATQAGMTFYGAKSSADASKEAENTYTTKLEELNQQGPEGFSEVRAKEQENSRSLDERGEVTLETEEHETTGPTNLETPQEKQANFDKEKESLVKERDRAEDRSSREMQKHMSLGRAFGEVVQGLSQSIAAGSYTLEQAKQKLNETIASYRSDMAKSMESEMNSMTSNARSLVDQESSLRIAQAQADGVRV